jgi:hypothetical protein
VLQKKRYIAVRAAERAGSSPVGGLTPSRPSGWNLPDDWIDRENSELVSPLTRLGF